MRENVLTLFVVSDGTAKIAAGTLDTSLALFAAAIIKKT